LAACRTKQSDSAFNGSRHAVVAGYLGAALGFYQAGQGAGWIGSIIGAIIVLPIYGKLAKK
jgi:uncharacterized membrane protein YeaQ/YmgE (transglycosylase-associated protein family)